MPQWANFQLGPEKTPLLTFYIFPYKLTAENINQKFDFFPTVCVVCNTSLQPCDQRRTSIIDDSFSNWSWMTLVILVKWSFSFLLVTLTSSSESIYQNCYFNVVRLEGIMSWPWWFYPQIILGSMPPCNQILTYKTMQAWLHLSYPVFLIIIS